MNAALKQKVETKVRECVNKIEALYGVKMRNVEIRYDINSARLGGQALLGENAVRFNPHFLEKFTEDYIATTVPHEVAHLGVHTVWQSKFSIRRPNAHGIEWKTMMRRLGVSPDRCHTFEADEGVGRAKNKFHYVCGSCKKDLPVGPKVHKKLQAGVKYRCRCGSSDLRLQGALGKVNYAAAKAKIANKATTPIQTAPVAKAPAKGTKLEQCYEYYKQYVGRDKELICSVFVNEVGMTSAGATTYYYQCKKLWEAS